MSEVKDLKDAWNYMYSLIQDDLPISIQRCLHIDVVRVNPLTEEIENDESLNTQVRVWLEFGMPHVINQEGETIYQIEPWVDVPDGVLKSTWSNKYPVVPTHDYDLDCGGKTFEEAFMKLYGLLVAKYEDKHEHE